MEESDKTWTSASITTHNFLNWARVGPDQFPRHIVLHECCDDNDLQRFVADIWKWWIRNVDNVDDVTVNVHTFDIEREPFNAKHGLCSSLARETHSMPLTNLFEMVNGDRVYERSLAEFKINVKALCAL